jgi:Leishmanolysin
MRYLSAAILTAGIAILSACSDNSGPPGGGGVLTSIIIRPGGNNQTALAGTPLPQPVIVVPVDAQNQTVPNQTATFAVTAGGGAIPTTTGTVNSDGSITVPTWTLGKSAVTQTLQVTVGSVTTNVNAIVTTAYTIDVRFFGRTLTAAQTALFTNAAARIRALVVGQLPPVSTSNTDVSSPNTCGATGVANLSEQIPGVIIFASIDSIDGPRKILAQSGPCYIRNGASGLDFRTSVGIMKFDSADINSLDINGNLQEVITHEMMHVVGFGSFWDSTAKNLLINYGTNVSYNGAGGIAGCQQLGAAITCASSVPVEGVQGGAGTINSHWRETTFGNELMTGFLNTGTNPLSVMSIRSLADLGYTVNPAAADPYTLPVGTNLRASFRINDVTATPTPGEWERPALPHPPRGLPTRSH